MASARHMANYLRLQARAPSSITPIPPQSETPEPILSRDGYLSERINSQAQAIAYITRNLRIEASSTSTSQSRPTKLSQVTNSQSVNSRKGTSHQIHQRDCDNPLPSIEIEGYDNEAPKRINIKLTIRRRQRKLRKSTRKEEPERYRAVGGVSGKLVFKRI